MARGEINGLAQGDLDEYLRSLRASPKFGPQVVWVEEIEGLDAHFSGLSRPLPNQIKTALQGLGVSELYSHQAEAINHIREGEHVIAATPTASGKSLIYNLPVFEHLLGNPGKHALYLFPLKALAQDQLQAIEKFAGFLPDEVRPSAAIYDGDTSAYKRKKIRDLPPEILISNPDMLHLSMLAYHGKWGRFWGGLSHVILDEVHTYRGVFGSHMAWVLRRLRRVCNFYGNDPLFILSSATVGNPEELAEKLLGQKARAIVASGASQGERKFVFLDPYDGAAYAASQLLEAALKRGLRTIVYTQSRKITELVSMWTSARLGDLKNKLTAYRAGFLPEDRRQIEAKLTSGELLGVVSTSALELGIDIGELELCILVGYPGSIMATWQRGGRVGRRQKSSLVVLIAQEDALDKYFMRNPADFFRRDVEAAILNPENPEIIKQHLLCLAAEGPIGVDEVILDTSGVAQALEELGHSGKLLLGADGRDWFTVRKYPQRQVNLRGAGRGMAIRRLSDRELLGEIDGDRCLKECHLGAVYLHMGQTYVVDSLDLEGCEILVTPKKVSYFTKALSSKETEILEVLATKSMGSYKVSFGKIRVTDVVSGYQRLSVRGHKLLATERLELPPSVFETEGVWIRIPSSIQMKFGHQNSILTNNPNNPNTSNISNTRKRSQEGEDTRHLPVKRTTVHNQADNEVGKRACETPDSPSCDRLHFGGGIHAIEHAVIGVFPLLALCDRNDVGGLSTPYHEQVQGAAVFIYDGCPGGIGLSKQAFKEMGNLLEEALQVITSCPCSSGCPSCVHSPKCGSGNRPIDKEAARLILTGLLNSGDEEAVVSIPEIEILPSLEDAIPPIDASQEWPGHFGVFDVETKRSAAEVGGWHRAERMGVSTVVLYDSKADEYTAYMEDEIEEFIKRLRTIPLVVGFNNKRFDNQVLSAYTSFDLSSLATVDILEEVCSRLGYRLSLDRLAKHTLGIQKSSDGLQALRWYKQGMLAEIVEYCEMDVRITKDLFLFGLENGYLLFQNKAGQTLRCPFHCRDSINSAR